MVATKRSHKKAQKAQRELLDFNCPFANLLCLLCFFVAPLCGSKEVLELTDRITRKHGFQIGRAEMPGGKLAKDFSEIGC